MDGNGRWAKLRGLPRKKGHEEGVKIANEVVDFCLNTGIISIVSLYVFSTENWKRSAVEVNSLFSLAKKYLIKTDEFIKKGIRVVFSSDYAGLPQDLVDSMKKCEYETKNCNKMILNLCLNYGGRAEILNAAKLLSKMNNLETVSEDDFLHMMYSDLPSPDLILRTGGQMRLSNFMLYQSAYAELFFSDVLWPDLTKNELQSVLDAFKKRIRNFGKVK